LGLLVRWIWAQSSWCAVVSQRLIALLDRLLNWLAEDIRGVFLELFNPMEGLLLHEEVHPIEPIVIFLKSGNFLLSQGEVLFPQGVEPIEVINVSLQLSILNLDIFVESLLVLQVSPQSRDLSVPKIQLILLRILGLT
jgi:hypothetical protein